MTHNPHETLQPKPEVFNAAIDAAGLDASEGVPMVTKADRPETITLTREEIQVLLLGTPKQQFASVLTKLASWHDGKEVRLETLMDYRSDHQDAIISRVRQWLNDHDAQAREDHENGELAKLDGEGDFRLDDIRALLGRLDSVYNGAALVSLVKLHSASVEALAVMGDHQSATADFLTAIRDEALKGLGSSPDAMTTAKLLDRAAKAKANVELLSQILQETADELGCENDNEAILQAIDDLKKRAAPDLDTMVQRFLGWKLPANFNPDNGITFVPFTGSGTSYVRREPVGTNLLDATQARAMIAHLLGADS